MCNNICFHKRRIFVLQLSASHFSCKQTHLFQQNYSCGPEFAGLYLLTQLSSHLIAYDNAKIIFSTVNVFYHTYLKSSFSPPSTVKTSPPLNHENKSYSATSKFAFTAQGESIKQAVLFQKPIFASYLFSSGTIPIITLPSNYSINT